MLYFCPVIKLIIKKPCPFGCKEAGSAPCQSLRRFQETLLVNQAPMFRKPCVSEQAYDKRVRTAAIGHAGSRATSSD